MLSALVGLAPEALSNLSEEQRQPRTKLWSDVKALKKRSELLRTGQLLTREWKDEAVRLSPTTGNPSKAFLLLAEGQAHPGLARMARDLSVLCQRPSTTVALSAQFAIVQRIEYPRGIPANTLVRAEPGSQSTRVVDLPLESKKALVLLGL